MKQATEQYKGCQWPTKILLADTNFMHIGELWINCPDFLTKEQWPPKLIGPKPPDCHGDENVGSLSKASSKA